MSFTPLSGGTSSALLGAIEPGRFIDPDRIDTRREDLTSRRIHGAEDKGRSLKYTILIVIISAIIFITVIALYDVIRNAISDFYATNSLTDPNAHYTPGEIIQTRIANRNALIASIVFAAFCVLSALVLIVIIMKFI